MQTERAITHWNIFLKKKEIETRHLFKEKNVQP